MRFYRALRYITFPSLTHPAKDRASRIIEGVRQKGNKAIKKEYQEYAKQSPSKQKRINIRMTERGA